VPPRAWRLRIEDMVDAAKTILDFTNGLEFAAFSGDRRTVDATVRNFEVMGEAARNVPEDVRQRYGGVPWSDVSEMRNVLIHEYIGVDLAIVWETIKSDLPPLVAELERILRETER
jgi:uncharacterized protein with HEPN domain